MNYGKYIKDGYIYGISDNGGEAITEDEYNKILAAINNKPECSEGYGYRLTEELQWEQYELPIHEEFEEDGLMEGDEADGYTED